MTFRCFLLLFFISSMKSVHCCCYIFCIVLFSWLLLILLLLLSVKFNAIAHRYHIHNMYLKRIWLWTISFCFSWAMEFWHTTWNYRKQYQHYTLLTQRCCFSALLLLVRLRSCTCHFCYFYFFFFIIQLFFFSFFSPQKVSKKNEKQNLNLLAKGHLKTIHFECHFICV